MNNCTEIRFFNLSKETLNRLGNADPVLDLPGDFSLRLSKSVEKLSVANKIQVEGALGFSAPRTKTNNALLLEFYSPNTLNQSKSWFEVSVQINGHTIMFTRLVVKESGPSKDWELELRRPADHWAELASNLTVDKIDFGLAAHSYLDIENSWNSPAYSGVFDPDDNDASRTPIFDYGGWVDRTELPQGTETPVRYIAPEDCRPVVSFPFLLKQGFCQIGWTIDGVIFDSDYFLRLWLYILKENYYDADQTGMRIRGRNFDKRLYIRSSSTYRVLRFFELIKGVTAELLVNNEGFTPAWTAGIENDTAIAMRYKFIFKGTLTNEGASPWTAIWQVFEIEPADNNDFTGEILSDPQDAIVEEVGAGASVDFNFSIEATLQAGQKAALQVGYLPTADFYVEGGMYFEVQPVDKVISRHVGTYEVADCISDQTTLLDWVKVAMHLFNGRLEPDFRTKTLTIHPRRTSTIFGETIPGFIKEEEASVDLEPYLVRDSIVATPVRPEKSRYTRIQFAESSDAYIDSLNLEEPAHSRKINNGADLPDDVEELENPVVEPTLEGQIQDIGSDAGGRAPLPYVPRLWDNTDGERSFSIGPRIFYAFGLVRQKNPNPTEPRVPSAPVIEYCSFFWDNPVNIAANDPAIDYFGYWTQLRTLEIDPTPSVDANVVFGTKPDDLFVAFYLGLIHENRAGTKIDALFFIRMGQYNDYDFRSLFRFSYAGRPVQAEMIEVADFAPCLRISTPIEFFVPPQESECCDLPCGCVFTTCEYYQDLGTYLRQATLDDLRLASFVVDGLELVASPLPFGELELKDIGPDTYVTNLVDLLNSVGAPYFEFGISTRKHPTRGLRYFTVTKPICVPFSILITNAGADAYMYTHENQYQKWFQGTWEALGYGADTTDVPENCITFTQY